MKIRMESCMWPIESRWLNPSLLCFLFYGVFFLMTILGGFHDFDVSLDDHVPHFSLL